MANAKKASVKVKKAGFDPASLTKEQQEAVVEEYLGYHPNYFLYEGLSVRLNHGKLEAEERNKAKKTGKPRKFFNGWKPNPSKYR